MTWELPLWPLVVATQFAGGIYLTLWYYGRRLDREDRSEPGE